MDNLLHQDTEEVETVLTNRNEHGDLLVFGSVTRDLLILFDDFSHGSQQIYRDDIKKAFNSIQLYPSTAQVEEMLLSAHECCQNTDLNSLTFGQFAFFASLLKKEYQERNITFANKEGSLIVNRKHSPRTSKTALPVIVNRSILESRIQILPSALFALVIIFNDVISLLDHPNVQVFLGGACNPTTWRKEIAIPILKDHCITYFNPQVEEWFPALIEVEEQAKQTAELLLFVIEESTRGLSSMVEAAYVAGSGGPLILVLRELPETETAIAGETLSASEKEDLNRGRKFLRDTVERVDIPVFTDIETAIHCCAKVIKVGTKITNLTTDDGAQPVRLADISVDDSFIAAKEKYDDYNSGGSGKLTLNEVALAYKAFSGKALSQDNVEMLSGLYESDPSKIRMSFEEFCCLLTEMLSDQPQLNYLNSLFNIVSGTTTNFINWLFNGGPDILHEKDESVFERDIFLGGSCGRSTWREDVAIPLLKKQAISYFNPQLPDWSMKFLGIEAEAKKHSRLLLYFIGNESRCVASMVEIAYYIGLGRNVVLCIQNFTDGNLLDGVTVTGRSLLDYNRARSYLSDIANRASIPVFDDITEAIMSAIQEIKLSSRESET
ncbi:hypothetical protein TrispH2_009332 [Trichoplax sp. H2]|nr:hypothetical protein TrispH2_009332 [Trichoplax sp. H2]|eukprot:RDD39889.1 hypothetical protein TrispH2_009332 [Trichoplax sp. H2]